MIHAPQTGERARAAETNGRHTKTFAGAVRP